MLPPEMVSSSDRNKVLRYDTLRDVLTHSNDPFCYENSKLPEYGIQRPRELPVNWVKSPFHGTFGRHGSDCTDGHDGPGTRELFSHDNTAPTRSDTRLSERRGLSSAGGVGNDYSSRRDGYPPREQLPLPTQPPYTAHIGNMSFPATEGDVSKFFRDCEVTNVRIIEDKLYHRPVGFGYVEFGSLEGLKKALSYNGNQLGGRAIRIRVAHPLEITQKDANTRQEAEILRNSRQEPQLKETFCDICDEHPQGVYGEHELRRHFERYHPSRCRKVWICRDSPNSQRQPIVPLASCEACRSQKTYRAEYKAADHLQSVHFCADKNERGGWGTVCSYRDGMLCSDELSMDELKKWMFEKKEIDVSASVELQNISQLVVSRRKDLVNDAPPRAPDNKSASPANSTSKSVDSAIGLSRHLEGSTGGSVDYEHLFGDGSLSEHGTLGNFGGTLLGNGGRTAINDSRRSNSYSNDYLNSPTLPAEHPWNEMDPSHNGQSNETLIEDVENCAPIQTFPGDGLRPGHFLRNTRSVPENSARGYPGLAIASDARMGSCEEISTPKTQPNTSMAITSPPEEEIFYSEGHPESNTPQPESGRSSPQLYSLVDAIIELAIDDADQEKALQSLGTAPESEGENSFIEGWEDHQSPDALANEDEILLTNICDSLSCQLKDTYISGLRIGQNDVQLGVPGYNSCAGSDSSTAVSQKSKDTNAVSQTTAPTTELPLSKKRDREDGDNDEQSRDQKKKKPRLSCAEAQSLDGRLLACPYFKYDPTRYSERNVLVLEQTYRGCSSCILRDISRLKQHLYRVHRRPDHYCGRCSEEFASQDALDAHTRAETRCDAADPRYPEKMTSNQLTCIKRKKPGRNFTPASFIVHAERHGPALLSGLISTDLQNLRFYRQHDRQIVEEAMERAFPQVIRELSRGFSQFSSQSDVHSSQSALASSSALGEIGQPVAPRDAALRSTLNSTSALFEPDQSVPLEPPQVYSVPGLDHQPQPDLSAYQDLSVGQAARDWGFVPFTNTSADDEAFLAQNESLTRHADPQSDFWGMLYPTDIGEAHNPGDNIFQSNQRPNGGPYFPSEE